MEINFSDNANEMHAGASEVSEHDALMQEVREALNADVETVREVVSR